MKLLHCHIENFGGLSGFDYDFTGGLNILCRKNGFGKSTLAVFIKAMFYGLPVTSKRDISENERKKYRPWKGGVYGGALEFEAEGKRYRIERFFGAREKDDRFALYDLDTGKPSAAFEGKPGIALFGVDADGFERSVYISQRMPRANADNSTIKGKLGDLLDATDDLGNYDKAEELLQKESRRYVTTGGRGRIADIQKKLSEKEAALEECQSAMSRAVELLRRAEETAERKAEITKEIAVLTEKEEALKKADKRRLRQEEQALLYRRLLEAKQAGEKEAEKAALFFGGKVPDDREMKEAEALLAEYEKFKAHVENCILPPEKAERLAALRMRYESLPFSAEHMAAIDRAKEAIGQAEKEVGEKTPRPDPILEKEKGRFANLDRNAVEEVRITRNLCEEDENAIPQKPPLLAFVFFALGILVGIAGFPARILSPILTLALAACSAVLILLGIILLLRTRKANVKQKALAASHREKLSAFLRAYGCEGSPSETLLLLSEMERYLAAQEEAGEQSARYAEAKAALEETKAFFASLLSPFGEEEPALLAGKVKADFEEYARLFTEEKAMLSRRATWETALHKIEAALHAFLSRYGQTAKEERAAYQALLSQKLLYGEKVRQAEKAKAELASFLAESGFDPDAPIEESGEAEALKAEKDALFNAAGQAQTEIFLLQKEAEEEKERAVCHTLLAERDALLAEKAEAEATYSALEKTKKFLHEAKEGLSTRYLGGMEQSFGAYMQALSDENTGYRFDTDLTLRAEKGGERREMEELSAGERDLALFCGRLSLIDAIFRKEKPMLLLDDPFVNLDDEHYAAALQLLATLADKMQILYLVCREEHSKTAI